MERPVSRVVRENIEGPYGADRNVDRCFRPLRTLRHPAAVGAADREVVTVQMDGMIGHAEIADPHAHAIAQSHGQWIDSGKHAAVPGPHVEIGHFRDLRHIGAWIEIVGTHDKDEVAIDRSE